jgi:hypothetical protein
VHENNPVDDNGPEQEEEEDPAHPHRRLGSVFPTSLCPHLFHAVAELLQGSRFSLQWLW